MGRGVALQPLGRSRRRLHLGQAIDLIVVEEHRHVHVVTDGVDPVGRADAAAIAVTGVDEHVQVLAGHAYALGQRQRAPVDTMEAVGLHVMGEAAGATDPRHEHGLLWSELLVTTQTLYRRQDRVVATSGAPAWHATLVILEFVALFVEFSRQRLAAVAMDLSPWRLLAAGRIMWIEPFPYRLTDRAGLDRRAPYLTPAVYVDQIAGSQQHRQRRMAPVVLVYEPVLQAITPVRSMVMTLSKRRMMSSIPGAIGCRNLRCTEETL